MDNQEFLSLLNENAKTKEEVLREQEAEELRKQQKKQQNIRAFDQFLCDRFKDVLVEAVGKGLAKNANGKRIVEGHILFINQWSTDSDDDLYEQYVSVEIEDFSKKIIDGYYDERGKCWFKRDVTLIPNCNNSSVGYRNFFSEYKPIEYTYKTFWGKTKTTTSVCKVVDDEEALASFINFFNSELAGVAQIVRHICKAGSLSRYREGKSCRFFFIAEF